MKFFVIFVYFVVNKHYPKIEEKIGEKIALAKAQRTLSEIRLLGYPTASFEVAQ